MEHGGRLEQRSAGMTTVAVFCLSVCCVTHVAALPSYVGHVLSGIELSIPTGDDAESSQWQREDDQLRVQDSIYAVLRRMGSDKTNTALRDPFELGSWQQEAAGVSVQLSNMALSGLKDYTVGAVSVNLINHEFSYNVSYRRLSVIAQYELTYYWSQNSGHVHVTLDDVTAHTRGLLQVHANGTVQPLAGHSHTTLTYQTSTADVDSPGLVNALAHSAISMVAPYLCDFIQSASMSPVADYVAQHCSVYVPYLDDRPEKADAVKEEEQGDSAGPLVFIDAAIRQMRQQVRNAGYDPLSLPSVEQTIGGGVRLALGNGSLVGLSSLRRAGRFKVSPAHTRVEATLTLGTGRVAGRYRWTLAGHRLLQRSGFVQFSVDGVRLRARLTHDQGRPRLEDLDVEVGAVSVRSEGAGSIDYLINMGTDSLAGHIRTILENAIKNPLRWVISSQTSFLPTNW